MTTDKTFGFNCSFDFFLYPLDMISYKPLLKKCANYEWRIGGTFSKEIEFSANYKRFTQVDTVKRDAFFKDYWGFNKKSTPIWPFICILTDNLTKTATAKIPINLQTHYLIAGSARKELIVNYKTLDLIKTKADLDKSAWSPLFKSKVNDNLMTVLVCKYNMVEVPVIETGNEQYLNPLDNFLIKFTSDLNGVVWSKNKGETELSLAVFSSLCGLYCRLFRELDPNLKIGIPMATEDTGGHAAYNAYLKKNKSIIGYDYEVKHLYGEKISMEGISVF